MMEQGTQEARALSEALRESEERLRLVQAAGGVGSVDLDLRTGMVWRSDEYIALHGMPPDTPRRQRYSASWLDRVHPDDREQVRAWLAADAAAPCEFEHEYRIVRRDTGETRWLVSRGRVTGDPEGRPLRVLSMQTDITERKRAELDIAFRADLSDALRRIGDPVEVLRTAAARIGRHLRADYACFGEIDPTAQWAEVHAAWAREETPDMLGRFPLSDFSPEMVARLTAGQAIMLDDIGDRTDVSTQVRLLGVRAILDVPIVRDGRLVAVLAIYQRQPRAWQQADVDLALLVAERAREAVERAQAERALSTSEERMRLAIAGTGIGTFDMDLATGAIIWSDTAFQLLGLPVAPDGRATLEGWLARLHPDDMISTPTRLAEAAMHPGPWEITHRIVRADTGEIRWMQALGVIIGPADGARSIGVVIDVTERKRSELRQAFQLGLAEKLRTATSTRAATEAIAAMIAGELGVDSAGFLEIDIASRTAWVIAGHGRVAARLAHQPWSFAGADGPLRGVARGELMTGRTFVVADLATDPRTAAIAQGAEKLMEARAMIVVPLMRGASSRRSSMCSRPSPAPGRRRKSRWSKTPPPAPGRRSSGCAPRMPCAGRTARLPIRWRRRSPSARPRCSSSTSARSWRRSAS
ncbi:PAS domain-containing protein [Sphingomonas changnyeongensis]|nr:PAS domain-containing protein [Sphingomonas changnyeongensis]